MKRTVSLLLRVPGVGSIESPDDNPMLLHFLTPLQRAAFRNKFQPFEYDIDGVKLEIDRHMCRDLFWKSRREIKAYRVFLQPARQKLLKDDIKAMYFLTCPLIHHKLPNRLYHILIGKNLNTMSQVIALGEEELKRLRGMGKKQMTYLINLFVDNGCGSLFL